jgi:hypothetical protein
MKTSFVLLLTAIIIAGASCKRELTTEDYTKQENDTWLAYCTNDVRAAEKALLDHLKIIPQFESNHVEGTDYDGAKALDHEGLFLIYRKTHETNKMEFEFQQSMEYLARYRHTWKIPPPPPITYDEFARELDMREQRADVKWKTNIDLGK